MGFFQKVQRFSRWTSMFYGIIGVNRYIVPFTNAKLYCACAKLLRKVGYLNLLLYPESIEHNGELAQEFESTKLHKQFTPTPVRFLMSCGILK